MLDDEVSVLIAADKHRSCSFVLASGPLLKSSEARCQVYSLRTVMHCNDFAGVLLQPATLKHCAV